MEFQSKINASRSTFLVKYEKMVSNPQEMMKRIGFDAQNFSRNSFRNQKLGNSRPWKKRAVPNLAGIWSDINNNKTPPKRRFDPSPALVDSGTLRKSISFELIGQNSVRIGTNRPNAKILYFGGTIIQKKTNPNFDDDLWRWLKRIGPFIEEKDFLKIAQLAEIEELETTVPGRKFLGYEAQRAKSIIREYIQERF